MTAHISHPPFSAQSFQAKNLTCVRGDQTLFASLSFALTSGECLHVRGENGVGKTSLLRLLAGLSQPEQGEVIWNASNIKSDREAFHQALCFLGHRDALKEDLSALENLMMYATLGASNSSRESALQCLWQFGLRGREDLPVHYLSAGQKKRVVIARIAMRGAPLWILDEPFNALDSQGVQGFIGLVEQHLSRGGIAVLTGHQDLSITGLRALQL
ncbi:cytochrome c biogenesis heme-transporting ATPase CcmA [Polynucleobacter paneuropaeus]|nr:cytochrome c biogenesis heme-transporting ATPase CcmA [Polynucleobacter paneuropaeus]MBT8600927.1 cytochrome c biogenesis heme-transporting ATPase CcmA [Polynucleobacter paneuropaeus]